MPTHYSSFHVDLWWTIGANLCAGPVWLDGRVCLVGADLRVGPGRCGPLMHRRGRPACRPRAPQPIDALYGPTYGTALHGRRL